MKKEKRGVWTEAEGFFRGMMEEEVVLGREGT